MLSRAFFAADIEKYKNPIYISSGTFWANYQAMMANQALNNTSFADDTDNVQEMSRSISRYDMAQLITNIMTSQGFPASSSDKSAAIAKITDYNNIPSQYRDAVANVYALGIITGYCGGWAALVSDYIFGQTGFPARKITTADARPGDIGISVDGNGKATHIFIITSRAQHNDECQWTEFDTTDSATHGPNDTYIIEWDGGHCDWDDPQPGDWTVDIWTRYPN